MSDPLLPRRLRIKYDRNKDLHLDAAELSWTDERLKALEAENARLKKLLAESMLENEVTREALRKKWVVNLNLPPPSFALELDDGLSPAKGSSKPLVTIVGFSDFECPFCSAVQNTLKQIVETYGRDVRLVFKHLPSEGHRNSLPAARAAYCANEQDRFWQFHGHPPPTLGDREALLSPALADELGAAAGSDVLVRVQRPSDIPLESLHGRKDDVGQTLRLDVRQIVAREALGDFALDAQQADVRAVFVPLAVLQEEIERTNRVNALLLSARPNAAADAGDILARLVRDEARLEDAKTFTRPWTIRVGTRSPATPRSSPTTTTPSPTRSAAASRRCRRWSRSARRGCRSRPPGTRRRSSGAPRRGRALRRRR